MILLCRNILLLLLIHTLKNYVQTLFLQVSHWQIFLSALDKCHNTPSTFIHSFSFWPAHFSCWLLFTSAAVFLPPTHQPKLFFSPCITHGPSSPHPFPGLTPASAQLATPAIAFPASAIQLFQVLLWDIEGVPREGAAATSFVRMLGEIFRVVVSLPRWSVLSHRYFLLQRLLTFKKDLVFDVAICYEMTSVLHWCSDFWLMDVPSPLGPMMLALLY